jgi:hypothetical protein
MTRIKFELTKVAGNLVEFIDTAALPMGRPAALGMMLLRKLMTTLPREADR